MGNGAAYGYNGSCPVEEKCGMTGPEGIYEEFKFKQRNLEIINGHDASDADAPLFLCYTSHIVHEPLQVPVETWNEFDFIGTSAVGDFQNHRQTYHASASIDSAFIFPPAVLTPGLKRFVC